ncbi:MAG: protein kinase family protein [Candidatus Sumerlaeia bacterium]|nr:protein kinase family protein [Candidatus Sumerlaeia bacterium]
MDSNARVRFLDAGAEARVYRVETPAGPQAAKEFAPGSARAFHRELSLLSRVRHPHIVELLGFEDTPDARRLYLEFCAGGSLRAYLERRPVAGLETLFEVWQQIASALAELHRHGIVHCDVKPGNILLRRNTRAEEWVLSDFGLAIDLRSGTRHRFCTEAYAAPEAKCGERSPAEDVFALGAVLDELRRRVDDPGASLAPLLGRVDRFTLAMRATAPAERPSIDIVLERCDEARGEFLAFRYTNFESDGAVPIAIG